MSSYENMIIEDTGCDPSHVGMIERIMREDIFRGTLDWQTRPQLRRAVREAVQLLEDHRALYELECVQTRAVFEQMRQAAASKHRP